MYSYTNMGEIGQYITATKQKALIQYEDVV